MGAGKGSERRGPFAADPEAWVCALLVATGCGVAFVHLGTTPFWIDEAMAVLPARSIHTQGLPLSPFDVDFMPWQIRWGIWDPATPLYRYAVGVFTALVGFSEWTTRAFSVLMGLALMLPLYHIGRSLYGRRSSWLALAFLATSPSFLLFAREARHYTLLALCITATLYWLLRSSGEHPGAARAFWVVGLVATLLTQTLGYLILPLTGLYVLLNGPRRFFARRYRAVYAVCALVYLAVLVPFWSTLPFFHVAACENRPAGCQPSPLYYLGVLHGLLAPLQERHPLAYWNVLSLPPLVFLVGLAATLRAAVTRAMPREKSSLLLLWLLLPLASLSLFEVKFPRYLFIWCMPPAALLVGSGVHALARIRVLRRLPLVEALLLLAVVASPQLWKSPWAWGFPSRPRSGTWHFVKASLLNAPTDNWERIRWQADQLRERAGPDDVVVTSFDDAGLQYYLGRFVYGFLNSEHTDAFFLDLLRAAERRQARVWFVDTLPHQNFCLTGDPEPRSVDCRTKYRRFYERCSGAPGEGSPACLRLVVNPAPGRR